jgi:hypothetical protein
VNAPAGALPTSAALAQAAFDFRACAVAISDAANVFRAGLPQTFTLDDLALRYHGMSRDQVVALLAHHCGLKVETGSRLRPLVHLDHVLVLDAAIRKELVG